MRNGCRSRPAARLTSRSCPSHGCGNRPNRPDTGRPPRNSQRCSPEWAAISCRSRTQRSARRTPGVEVTLDAIAKGYAIHRAVQALQRFDLLGGLVDVGGDIECFGRPLQAEAWRIALQHPAADTQLLVLNCLPREGTLAVCTSGDYRRFVLIDGQRYSHIMDPRSGQPARAATSVTVVGPDAVSADGWATALSVMGPQEGLPRLPTEAGLEALLVSGPPDVPRLDQTPGFRRYVDPGGPEE